MPKEKINHPQFGVVIDPGSKDVPVGEQIEIHPAAVHIGWNRAGWVQVSIEADPSYFRFVADNPDGPAMDDGTGRTSAYSPPLGRDELNKLIRVLRRARDQAYGRDE